MYICIYIIDTIIIYVKKFTVSERKIVPHSGSVMRTPNHFVENHIFFIVFKLLLSRDHKENYISEHSTHIHSGPLCRRFDERVLPKYICVRSMTYKS